VALAASFERVKRKRTPRPDALAAKDDLALTPPPEDPDAARAIADATDFLCSTAVAWFTHRTIGRRAAVGVRRSVANVRRAGVHRAGAVRREHRQRQDDETSEL